MIITQYWIDALPFATLEEAQAAIADFDLYHPHDTCLITPFSRDGIFVRAFDYEAGTSGWLTTELRREHTTRDWYVGRSAIINVEAENALSGSEGPIQ